MDQASALSQGEAGQEAAVHLNFGRTFRPAHPGPEFHQAAVPEILFGPEGRGRAAQGFQQAGVPSFQARQEFPPDSIAPKARIQVGFIFQPGQAPGLEPSL
jgi:hypothetical protein